MVTTTSTWGWYAPSTAPTTPSTTERFLDTQYEGLNFSPGVNTTTHGFGEMAMVDGNDNGVIQARRHLEFSESGDRFRTPDGVDRIIEEVSIYLDSTISYQDPLGNEQIWIVRVVVYRLDNGSLVVRLRDDDRNDAPLDFFIENVTNIQLGTWDGTHYTGTNVGNFDDPPPNVCFTAGTLILTGRGEVAVENLRKGDLVQTRDAGLQPIRWIGSQTLTSTMLADCVKLRPIRIGAGALGEGRPARDLVVSPQHRILVRSDIARRLFGAAEVLVAAKQLLLIDGIDIAEDVREVEYFHFMFDDHQIVFANGAEAESLYTGPQTLRTVGPAALGEIYAIFPDLRDRDADFHPEGIRPLLTGRQGRKLAYRHAQNGKALYRQKPGDQEMAMNFSWTEASPFS